MKQSATSSQTLGSTESSSSPTKLPDQGNLDQIRKAADSQKIVAWVQEEYTRAKNARSSKQIQWYMNLTCFFGKQWAEVSKVNMPDGYRDKISVPEAPYYRKRKTINRIRSFVRSEHSKFLSNIPTVTAVPNTAEDQDVRSAFAAEQAWVSISASQKLRTHYTRAIWWMVVTGNGFTKTQWDNNSVDTVSGQKGVIKFGVVTPFHLFVPDLREQEIEDQPFIINAYIKPVSWCENYFGKALEGCNLKPSVASQNQILEEGYLNLSSGAGKPDSCIVYETWIKPGATRLLPQGGVVITVDDHLISMYEGMPYAHGQYPFTKFEHIPSSTFYADSPLVDLIPLNKEYNESRTDIAEAARRMGRPQLVAQRGSIVPSKITNEAGLVIEYKQGHPQPAPLPLAPLPQYVVEQQDRILRDFDDLSGQHEVTRGQAPAGVVAGTAINYLTENANQFLTPEYQSIEDGYQRIAEQTIGLFVQFVDAKRKIKTVGADGAFDSQMLSGVDVKNGTDIRVEKGSSIGQSHAAQNAQVQDMFAIGLIDQTTALRLMEVGGMSKVMDILHVAEKKAQRENIKMKALTEEVIVQHEQAWVMQTVQAAMETGDMGGPEVGMGGPEVGMPGSVAEAPMEEQGTFEGGMEGMGGPEGVAPQGPPPTPPIIVVDDFDVHEIHIETHNKFRMSQEYEMLPDPVKEQFARHVQTHEDMLFQRSMVDVIKQASLGAPMGEDPSMGGDPMTPPGQEPPPEDAGGPTMAGNGQVPDMTGGQIG